MSRENVERFLEASDGFNRRDIDAWLEPYDPDCVFEAQVAAMEGTVEGHEGLVAFLRGIDETFDVFRVEFDDVRDFGDRVLAIGTATTVGRGSGIEQRGPLAIIARFAGGRITHFKDFGDKRQALEAAGLSE